MKENRINQKLIDVDKSRMAEIAELFHGIEDSMVYACLQGVMGKAYADHLPQPTMAIIISGEYSFFGGDAKTPQAREAVESLFDYIDGDFTVAIYAENHLEWRDLLLSVPENNPVEMARYGIIQKDYAFDRDLLKQLTFGLPKGYDLVPFDNNLYEQAMSEDWSREFCEIFASSADYLEKGFGFGILDEGKLVSGASSMTVYNEGIEIQIATKESYRRKGLAWPCVAALIVECMKRGLRPCWDAATPASMHMALKLGYTYRGEYSTVQMSRHDHMNKQENTQRESSAESLNEGWRGLKADCENCFGLCCVALNFSASGGFPNDKPAGEPCINLQKDFRCRAHSSLREKGYKGCVAYECFGAGQKVAQISFKGVSWIQHPESAQEMYDVFTIMRQLQELIWYLKCALELQVAAPIHGPLKEQLDATEKLTLQSPEFILTLNMEAYRATANAILIKAGELFRDRLENGKKIRKRNRVKKPFNGKKDLIGKDLRHTDLVGANLRGAYLIAADLRDVDLNGAELIGADLRDADIRGADLSNTLFLTQAQVNTARGDLKTKLPPLLERPAHWKEEE